MIDRSKWQAEYPFAPNYFDVDGQRMHYVDSGRGDETVLAVHGNPTWSFYWRHIIRGLAPSLRVVAVDHIGCGLSDKPQDYQYSLATHRDNLRRLVEALDLQNITLLAHDWGGAIGLSAAVEMPHRIRRIALLNTAAFPPPYIPWRIAACRTPLLGTLAVRGVNLFARAAVPMAMSRSRLSAAARGGLLAPYDSWKNRVAIDRFVRDIPFTSRHATAPLLAQLEQRLSIFNDRPVLLVWGMRDWCFRPECLERFQQIWPHARTVTLDDVGHYVAEDAPQETLSAVESFLRET